MTESQKTEYLNHRELMETARKEYADIWKSASKSQFCLFLDKKSKFACEHISWQVFLMAKGLTKIK